MPRSAPISLTAIAAIAAHAAFFSLAACSPNPTDTDEPQTTADSAAHAASVPQESADPIADWSTNLAERLERDVRVLAEQFPSRSILAPATLEAAAVWLEAQLEDIGYDVQSQPYQMPGPHGTILSLRNLYVEVPSAINPDHWLVVGAHYDTVPDSPGADDNASGVAGVLALADYFHDRPQHVGLRFELYTNEETVFGPRSDTGAVQRARAALDNGDHIRGVIVLEMIGYYTGEPLPPNAQAFAAFLGIDTPDDDLFLAIATWEQARPFASRIADEWRRALAADPTAEIDVLQVVAPNGERMTARSDHWAYLQAGVPAVMLTDTAEFRNPHYHTDNDTPNTLDYNRMAQAVRTARTTIEALAAVRETEERRGTSN